MPSINYCLFEICFLFHNIKALLAAGVKKTKCTRTMRWLKSRQNPDGSFINLLSTIYVIPALIGALPYDLQDIRCPNNTTGIVHNVHCLQSVSPLKLEEIETGEGCFLFHAQHLSRPSPFSPSSFYAFFYAFARRRVGPQLTTP